MNRYLYSLRFKILLVNFLVPVSISISFENSMRVSYFAPTGANPQALVAHESRDSRSRWNLLEGDSPISLWALRELMAVDRPPG